MCRVQPAVKTYILLCVRGSVGGKHCECILHEWTCAISRMFPEILELQFYNIPVYL
jgi:hypothetical protein